MNRKRILFAALAALLIAGRLCHTGILWEGDTLPLAAAAQIRAGKTLYRDIWFDKPPLVPAFDLLSGARAGWALRAEDALYALLCCWLVYRFARDLWGEREGQWAAGLLGFFLIFDFPSAVIPVASDLMMLAPNLAAVWMAHRRRSFWSGALAGVAFWVSPKGALVAAVCAAWSPVGAPAVAGGFAAVLAAGAAALAGMGALGAYWEQVWVWGRLYAGSTMIERPVTNGLARTANWAAFHATAVIGAARFAAARERTWQWAAWLVLALAGVAMGMRFFPRYYFQLLPVIVLMAARGLTLIEGRRRELVALLLLIPLTRFAPSYYAAATDTTWRDISMDNASRAAAAFVRERSHPGDTLFVWGYRPELFPYSGLPAATIYLDSQPLTGVPADRHLTQSEPVETVEAARRRIELTRSRPTWVLDGLGLYNPRLAVAAYPELRQWLAGYEEAGRVGGRIVYREKGAGGRGPGAGGFVAPRFALR